MVAVVVVHGNSVIDGFTIQNGTSTLVNATSYIGGGIYVNSNSTCYITNSIIINNSVDSDGAHGGGVGTNGVSPIISNCIIDNNYARYSGGAVGNCLVYNSNLSNNSVTTWGAAANGGRLENCKKFLIILMVLVSPMVLTFLIVYFMIILLQLRVLYFILTV